MEKLTSKQFNEVVKILVNRHNAVHPQKMRVDQKKELVKKLKDSISQNRFVFHTLSNKKIAYFFNFKITFMGEFGEVFFHVLNFYCTSQTAIRKKAYKDIQESFLSMKKEKPEEKIKRLVVEVDAFDLISKKYFSKHGLLTYVTLIGDTKKGLKKLSKDKNKSSFKIERLKAFDVKKLVELDLESHISDKTSRMRKIFMKPNSGKKLRGFYKMFVKNKQCFVVKSEGKIAGSVAYFVNEKNKAGLIAAIFVAKEFKGLGVSKLLYKRLLEEFKKKKLRYYVGATTTIAVLSMAKKIGRREFNSAYIVKSLK